MTRLLIATRNLAKFERYRRAFEPFAGLTVHSPADLGLDLEVAEDGASAADNARLKAHAYAAISGLPALGIDEAMFIPALPPAEQPGVLVRRNSGRTLTDEEMLAHYLAWARRLAPEQRTVRWLFALCLAFPDGRQYDDQAGWEGRLSDRLHRPYQPGYPLSTLLIDAATGKPVSRLSEADSREREQPVYQAVARLVAPLNAAYRRDPLSPNCQFKARLG